MSASCHLCGETWPRDPALEVACPMCGAGVGVRCVRPSGHRAWRHEPPHVERDRAALDAGVIRPCPAVSPLFAEVTP